MSLGFDTTTASKKGANSLDLGPLLCPSVPALNGRGSPMGYGLRGFFVFI